MDVSENYTVSTFTRIDGAEYDETGEGIWLSDKFARLNDIGLGDTLTLEFQGLELSCEVAGLIKAGEHMICLADSNQLMMIAPMRVFCRMAGKQKFSQKDLDGMLKTAALNAADRNPYSWNMELLPYPDGSGYEARFSKCGICAMMRELGIPEIVPAMCRLDYAMSEAGGASEFVRQYTLASGGPYCDCGYKKKVRT